MAATLAIETTSLSKTYGDSVVVEGLDLSIEQGTVYGVLGPNGAGKTTTMRMLTTVTRPTAGAATVAGHPISDRGAVKPHIGYLPEVAPLYGELTGHEQALFFARLRDIPEREANDRIDQLFDQFGLTDKADQRIETYSKGMRQKIGIIGAILHEPAVVFLDEPTAGLDPRAALTVRETIKNLIDQDTTVFVSTHLLPVVDALADIVGVLHDGRLVAEGRPDELKQRAENHDEQSLENVFFDVTTEESTTNAR